MLFPCVYDKEQHEIINPPLLEWCRRQIPDPAEKARLFVYHHRVHGTFVIARWAKEPRGIFTDFLNLGYSLNNFNREARNEFLSRMFKPLQARTISHALNRGASDYRSHEEEKNDEMKEIMGRRASLP
jgi:hypothetical protein